MNEKELKIMNEAIAVAIQTHVNGKIDKLHAILERQNEKTDVVAQQLCAHLEKEGEFQAEIRAHMATVKPYLDAAIGVRVLRSFLLWVAGSVAAWLIIKNNWRL